MRARILEAERNYDPRLVSHRLLVEMTGKGSGNLGPEARLLDYYGERSFEPDHPSHGNVMLFYRELVMRTRRVQDDAARR